MIIPCSVCDKKRERERKKYVRNTRALIEYNYCFLLLLKYASGPARLN